MESNSLSIFFEGSNKQEIKDIISSSHDGLEDEMKRDMDFIRDLLLKIEDTNEEPSLHELLPANATETEYEKLAKHVSMLIDEAGFVSGISTPSMGAKNWTNLRLTWSGHDFLDSVRDPKIWEKTKKSIERTGAFTFKLLKDLAEGFARKQIEEFTGIKL